MIADLVELGKPVYIFAPDGSVVDRHVNFIAHHFQKGRVRVLENKLEKYTYESIRFTDSIALGLSKMIWPQRPVMCKWLF
jgi:mitochondrial fission protein ELM1